MARHASKAEYFPTQKAGARMTSSLADAIADLRGHVREKVLRSAAHAGAEVLYEELKLRAPAGPTGNLKSAIYQWHDDKRSNEARQIYVVGVNKSAAPHWALVEYGHMRINVVFRGPTGELIATKKLLPAPVWVPPTPYLRPSWEAKASAAVSAMQQRAMQRLLDFHFGELQ